MIFIYYATATQFVIAGAFDLGVYDEKPTRFLERIVFEEVPAPSRSVCCAGFELQAWRCKPFANHLVEWLPDYALAESELDISHGNMYIKLQQAAARVYTSKKYENRGEAGEIALHAICRDYFGTIPIAPRVFYKNSSNDVVKSFDMVHARFPNDVEVELWLGESKLYKKASDAITDAIASVNSHLEQGFLQNEKLLLGPQISRTAPNYDGVIELFRPQTSLDRFVKSSVFAIGIAANSDAVTSATELTDAYRSSVSGELAYLAKRVLGSGLDQKIRIVLIYIPLFDKDLFVKEFDNRLKGIQG